MADPKKQTTSTNTTELNVDASRELELPTPVKKNDVITDENPGTGKDDVKKTDDQKRGDTAEKETLERENQEGQPQDADWQVDKMNEANNQTGNDKNTANNTTEKTQDAKAQDVKAQDIKAQNVKAGRVDTREDSIINRPRTETYGNDPNENTGKIIKEDNYTHAAEEEKRQKDNEKKKLNDMQPVKEHPQVIQKDKNSEVAH